MSNEEWTERGERHDVAVAAELQAPDGSLQGVTIDNLSLQGCRIEGTFPIGQRIALTIPQVGRVDGQVRWAIGGRAGVRFLSSEAKTETA